MRPEIKSIRDYKSNDRDVFIVKWPGTDNDVGICSLNCKELQDAHFKARETFKKDNKSIVPASQHQFEAEEQSQQCYLMLVDPDAKTNKAEFRIFKNPEQCKIELEPYERTYFIDQFLIYMSNKIEKLQGKNVDES